MKLIKMETKYIIAIIFAMIFLLCGAIFFVVKSRKPKQNISSNPISNPISPSPIFPSPILPSPILPSPILPSPILPSPILPSPILPSPILPSPILPSPILPSPIQPPIVTPRVGPSPVPPAPLPAPLPNQIIVAGCSAGLTTEDLHPEPYIIAGTVAAAGKYPFMVDLNGCGAALIHPQWVLSAAHCPMGPGSTIKMGLFNRGLAETGQRQIKKALRVIRHPNYSRPYYLANDIMLIELDSACTITPYVKPICLPGPWNLQGKAMIVAGWGKTSTSQYSSIMLEAPQKEMSCPNVYSNAGTICAGLNSSTHCFGDSGGPMFLFQGGKYYITGICSATYGCKPPGIFTRVSYYVSWIRQHVKGV